VVVFVASVTYYGLVELLYTEELGNFTLYAVHLY